MIKAFLLSSLWICTLSICQVTLAQTNAISSPSPPESATDAKLTDDNTALVLKFNNTLKLALQNNSQAEYEVGRMYHHALGVKEDDKEALKWNAKSANDGFADAQYTLAKMYHDGDNVDKDFAAAFSWYTRAALQNRA